MAIYEKLFIGAGGGIEFGMKRAEQVENTATLFIGLGGTGIDCLRTIKTQVHGRLKPDDPAAPVPTYSHIRFLGIDEDIHSFAHPLLIDGASMVELDTSEFFSLRDKTDSERICHDRKTARLLMIEQVNELMARLRDELTTARYDLMSPTVNVHIFSSLAGNTGGGIFLDVCYMMKYVVENIGVNMYGYFFLPDVGACRIPPDDMHARSHLQKNGYAAMQELDYCMQLQYNGGAFRQVYKGGKKVEWDSAPVDMCHLIGAANADGEFFAKPFDHAMCVTAEYVMDFLTNSKDLRFHLTSHLANFKCAVSQVDAIKTLGSEMSYVAIGESCAAVPTREINTYLASKLFAGFSTIGGNTPNFADVERIASKALGDSKVGVEKVYESLLRKIRDGADGDLAPFPHDWKFVREQGDAEMVRSYHDQRVARAARVEANASDMRSAEGGRSLLSRVSLELEEAICDIDRGPIYAHRVLDASVGYNLLDFVDGLIRASRERWEQELDLDDIRRADCDSARYDFEAHQNALGGIGCRRRFETYERCLGQLCLHRLDLDAYEALNSVLCELRTQLINRDELYYQRLARITQNLVDTFEENRRALSRHEGAGFAEPLVTVEELRPALDAEAERVKVANMFQALMRTLLHDEQGWLSEDEDRIARLVNGFFAEQAFPEFSGRTVTRFLADKYGTTGEAQLADKVYDDWITKLTRKASPLFRFDPVVWDESRASKMAFISVPAASGPIKAAARRMQSVNSLWQVKESELYDRIHAMNVVAGFPLASYFKLREYEGTYYASHSECGAIDGQLPPITPQSYIDLSTVGPFLREFIEESCSLFDDAFSRGIIARHGEIITIEEGSLTRALAAIEDAKEFARGLTNRAQVPQARQVLERLREDTEVTLMPSRRFLRRDSRVDNEGDERRLLKDYFVSSPALHEGIRVDLERLKVVERESREVEEEIATAIAELDSPDLDDFIDALFAGIITVEGSRIACMNEVFGIKAEQVLSEDDSLHYPHCAIPLYQAFLSYRELDQESKTFVKDKTSERYNDAYDELQAVAESLRKELTDDRIVSWKETALSMDNAASINRFFVNLETRFETHCLGLGIA